MSQELSFSIWSLAPWIPSVLDHMVEFSAQTTMFLVKAVPEITGLRDIIQKVTRGPWQLISYKFHFNEFLYIKIIECCLQYLIYIFRC